MSAHQSNVTMVYIKEESLGVIPTEMPSFKILRYTGESFSPNVTKIKSEELRPDRRDIESRTVGEKPEGSFNFEFSKDTFDEFLPAVLWTDGTPDLATGIKDGSTLHSFSFERGHSDLGALANEEGFFKWSGCVPNVLELNLEAEQIVKGSLSFIGKTETISTVSMVGANTPDPVTTTKPINATIDVASLKVNDLAIPGFFAKSVSLSVNNGTYGESAIGVSGNAFIDPGTLQITGNLSGYFESLDFYEQYKTDGYLSLSFELKDPDSATVYKFELPKIQFTEDSFSISQGKRIGENISYSALPGVEGHMIKITKTA